METDNNRDIESALNRIAVWSMKPYPPIAKALVQMHRRYNHAEADAESKSPFIVSLIRGDVVVAVNDTINMRIYGDGNKVPTDAWIDFRGVRLITIGDSHVSLTCYALAGDGIRKTPTKKNHNFPDVDWGVSSVEDGLLTSFYNVRPDNMGRIVMTHSDSPDSIKLNTSIMLLQMQTPKYEKNNRK